MTPPSGMLTSIVLILLCNGITVAQPPDRPGREGGGPVAGHPDVSGTDRPGQPSAGGPAMLMALFDTDRDGELSAEEIGGAEAALKRLDRNGDGKLTREELRSPLPGQGRGAVDGRGFGRPGPGRVGQAGDAGTGRGAAGPAGFGSSLIWLLGVESLHEELKLTEEQSAQFRKTAEKFAQQFRDQGPEAPRAERDRIEKSREQAIRRAQEIEKQIAAVLKPDQLRRLNEIELQQQAKFSGPTVLLQPTVADALRLTAEQRQELGDLASELNRKRNALFQELRGLSPEERGRKMAERRGEMERLAEEALQKATALLTPDQQDKLKQVMGEPFELERPGPPAQPRSDRPRSQTRAPEPRREERTESRRTQRDVDNPPATAREDVSRPVPEGEGSRLGVGFLIGKGTEELIPLLSREKDFLEMMLGPEKVRYIRELKPPARAMCISENLEGVARAVKILQEANIEPERVYIAYNPEPRPPGARQCTPREELDDYLASVKKARELVKDYGAPLVMAPGLIEMAKREHLYPEMAKHCDIWMIQTQRLQFDLETQKPTSDEHYRAEVKRIVGLLRQGNPDIQVFVQIIPLQATPERREVFTAERLASYLLAVEDLVGAAKIYGGNTELIAELIHRLRNGRPQQPVDPGEKDDEASKQTVMIEMRDGARLATDLYLPVPAVRAQEQGGIPVVLVRTPYNKDQEHRGVVHWRDFLVDNGYAFAVQDMRGFYASATGQRRGPGQYDGYDTIEWLAQQPWCNGKVGMMGYSHLGAAQYEAAVTQPPHLACAIPAQAPGNYYTDADAFPPKSEPTRYYVHSDHTLRTEAPTVEDDSLRYEYDPKDPVPTVGRVHARLPVNGPYDQREVESRADVLVFTTPPLAKPLEIVGQVQAKLWASSDRKDTDFTVKLTDVYPDGRSMIFLDGIVKGRYRNGYLEEELLEPGKVVELDIDLGYIAIVLAPGHRLRVAISSSNFDRWDINPNTGEPYGAHALTQSLLAERLRVESFQEEPEYSESLVATNTLCMDASRPSYVLLPIPVEKAGAPTVRQVSSPAANEPLAATTREDNDQT